MNRPSVQKNTVQKALLYSIVFEMRAIRYITAILFMFFVMHPATPAFASEDIGDVEDAMEEVETVVEETIEDLEQEDPEATEEIEVLEESIDNEDTEAEQSQENIEEVSETDGIIEDTDETTETGVPAVETQGDLNDEEDTDTATSTDDSADIVDEIDTQEDADESTEEVATATTTASTTEGSIVDAYVVDSSAYTFDQSQCVEVSGGAFYCSAEENTSPEERKDALYATHDAQGDMEIYFVQDGKEYQVTDNVYDDVAPTYDPKSHSIVWHRLLNDRYQIVSYDVDSGKEDILTNNNANDMEPARTGGVTVWQRWVGNNWEIILLDNGNEIQLTSNAVHDIGPKINGNFILWHTTSLEGEKKVALYDMDTDSFTVIDDADDGAIENPRFILMYDKTFSNGDTVTKGIDVLTGEIVPLSAAGGTLPDDIPESDPTGETRALINQKTSGSRDEQVDIDDDIVTPIASSTDAVATASSSVETINPEVLVVPVASSTDGTVDTPTSTSTDHIADVIIPSVATTTHENVE